MPGPRSLLEGVGILGGRYTQRGRCTKGGGRYT